MGKGEKVKVEWVSVCTLTVHGPSFVMFFGFNNFCLFLDEGGFYEYYDGVNGGVGDGLDISPLLFIYLSIFIKREKERGGYQRTKGVQKAEIEQEALRVKSCLFHLFSI